ncbi:MAG: MotA/TolQ/ExbB proton channel family protein [Elusimicrobia bacterium]|nr:MotA/TolQ/ExbB proton channel family protein [Elusimicrobiota bacterium]
MESINYLEILKSSFTMVILIGCSILSLTITIERWLFFRKIKANMNLLGQIDHLVSGNKLKDALSICEKQPGPITNVVKAAIVNHQKSKEQVSDLLTAVRLEEKTKMENLLSILGTMGNTAPFIGLFGTVVGIIKAFHDLARSGSGGPSVVAAGIAEALVATAAGLAVAIPAAVIYNYFLRKVKVVSTAMEATSLKILTHL